MHAAEIVESYIDAWNHRDPRGVASHLAKDGIYIDVPAKERHTRSQLVNMLSEFFSHEHNRYELIGSILTAENSIAFQYRARAVCPGPAGDNAYTGAEFMVFRDGQVIAITDYYDLPNSNRPLISRRVTRTRMQRRKYAKSGLGNATLAGYMRKLTVSMQSDQLYLRPELTLPLLAEIIGCSVNHLSQVINAGFGQSFFDYLNHHRVEYAKRLLRDKANGNNAILDIALAAGFNSSSAFYSAFKKSNGMSPAKYRSSSNVLN